jgi:hypothetical protein
LSPSYFPDSPRRESTELPRRLCQAFPLLLNCFSLFWSWQNWSLRGAFCESRAGLCLAFPFALHDSIPLVQSFHSLCQVELESVRRLRRLLATCQGVDWKSGMRTRHSRMLDVRTRKLDVNVCLYSKRWKSDESDRHALVLHLRVGHLVVHLRP